MCPLRLLLTAIDNLLARPPTASSVRERIFLCDARPAAKILVVYPGIFTERGHRRRDADYVTFRLSEERRRIGETGVSADTDRRRETESLAQSSASANKLDC